MLNLVKCILCIDPDTDVVLFFKLLIAWFSHVDPA